MTDKTIVILLVFAGALLWAICHILLQREFLRVWRNRDNPPPPPRPRKRRGLLIELVGDYARIVGLQTLVSKVRKKMLVSGRLYRGYTYGSPAALGTNM